MEKIIANISKVTNILELRDRLGKKLKVINGQMDNIKNMEDISNKTKELEVKLSKLISLKEEVIAKQKDPKTSEEESKRLDVSLQKINEKINNNNTEFAKNQTILAEKANSKNTMATKEQLEKQSFDIKTKVSKCNMIANNLMNGLSWNQIEIKLDNWKDRKFTSKEKLSELAKGEQKQKEEVSEEKTERKIAITTEEVGKNISEKVGFDINKDEKQKEDKEQVKEESLVEVSEFEKKHPRLAKITNWFKNKSENRKKIKEAKKEAKKEPKEEPKEEQKKEEVKQELPDNDFKKYLKEVAENGMKEAGKDKLEKAKQQAYERESKKFGKDYAEMSYKKDENSGR